LLGNVAIDGNGRLKQQRSMGYWCLGQTAIFATLKSHEMPDAYLTIFAVITPIFATPS